MGHAAAGQAVEGNVSEVEQVNWRRTIALLMAIGAIGLMVRGDRRAPNGRARGRLARLPQWMGAIKALPRLATR